MPKGTITPRRVARKLYKSSPETLLGMGSRRFKKLARKRRGVAPAITLEYLRSAEYRELMSRHVPYDNDYGLHEAQTATKSFNLRAFEADHILRAFRWRGVEENLDLILDEITGPGKLVADLGGAASPFGLGSFVVDQLPIDADGNPVPYRSLDDLPGPADVVLSSHTLEHIPPLEEELGRIRDALKPGGKLLALLPAFSCERWRAGIHSHASFGDHVWTFGLSGTPGVPEGLVNYVEIDTLLSRYFEVESASYCGDDSIFAVCKRT
jgi:SAM-dependent methyltransferase